MLLYRSLKNDPVRACLDLSEQVRHPLQLKQDGERGNEIKKYIIIKFRNHFNSVHSTDVLDVSEHLKLQTS